MEETVSKGPLTLDSPMPDTNSLTSSPENPEGGNVMQNNEEDTNPDDEENSPSADKVGKKKKWRKPKDKPKRPLSAYNIFFRQERENLLYGGDVNLNRKRVKIGFSALAKNIAAKWKRLDADARRIFEVQADFEQLRYKAEVEEWKRNQEGGSSISDNNQSHESRWPLTSEMSADLQFSNCTPREQEFLHRQHNQNALANQMMISQLMKTYNGVSVFGNNNVLTANHNNNLTILQQMGQQYVNPMAVYTEAQNNLNLIDSSNFPLFLGAYNPLINLSAAANAPRRMSMPTSTEQFAQMQRQHQQFQEDVSMVNLPGGRRFSMPIGIIDNTQHLNHEDRRGKGMTVQEIQQQMQVREEIQQLFNQHAEQYGNQELQAHISSQQEQQQQHLHQEQVLSYAANDNLLNFSDVSNGYIDDNELTPNSKPREESSMITGRRLSMPLSVEQHVLERNSIGLASIIPNQSRSMSMPLGLIDSISDQRGIDSLDELADILKDDGDLFDW
jgi:HMG (high mobility group) box